MAKAISVLAALILLFGVSAYSQTVPHCPVMPPGLLCISQQAGNQAAENKRELDATKAENVILKQTVADREADIKKLQEVGRQNVAEVTDRLHKTEVSLAEKTGELVKAESQHNDDRVMIQFLLQHGRVRQMGLINLKF